MKIGLQELLLLFIVALIVLGPDKMPEYARKLGEALKAFKKYSAEATKDIREGIVEPLEEAQKPLREAMEPVNDLQKTVHGEVTDLKKTIRGLGQPAKAAAAQAGPQPAEDTEQAGPQPAEDAQPQPAASLDKTPEPENGIAADASPEGAGKDPVQEDQIKEREVTV